MAFPTTLNSQITDSITQIDTLVVGLSPAIAMGELYLATSAALADAAHNATFAQGQINQLAQAVTTAGVAIINKTKPA